MYFAAQLLRFLELQACLLHKDFRATGALLTQIGC